MRLKHTLFAAVAVLFLAFTSCESDQVLTTSPEEAAALAIAPDVIDKIQHMGFSTDGIEVVEEGYRVERDIILTHADLKYAAQIHETPEKQYSTNNLVATGGNRVITIYAPTGRRGYSAAMIAGLDLAIQRYNDENLTISFQRVTSSNSADITMKRLSRRDERRGVLGSAGFPTSGGDPYGEIKMSGILESSYGLSTEGIATIIAHEMGHCIGFRHTDFFDRSISCGGSPANEGTAGVGANHIPGTPTGASASAGSWMLSCTDGSDRPFNNDDQTALDYLY